LFFLHGRSVSVRFFDCFAEDITQVDANNITLAGKQEACKRSEPSESLGAISVLQAPVAWTRVSPQKVGLTAIAMSIDHLVLDTAAKAKLSVPAKIEPIRQRRRPGNDNAPWHFAFRPTGLEKM